MNDFFCHDDTWQRTVGRLVHESDVVLMDLRGFSPHNAGCAHELRELVNAVPLDRVVLAVDDTTDTPFMEHTLREAWQTIRPESPNLHGAVVRIVRMVNRGNHSVVALLRLLSEAAERSTALRQTA